MNTVQQKYFSDELENLREVVASILTYCGERLVSLSELWTLLTAYKCLKDQVNLTKNIPSEDQITFTLDGNPTFGAAHTTAPGPLEELVHCPYRVALCDDMKVAVRFARNLSDQGCTSHEFQQALLFVQDAHAYLLLVLHV
eukprot:s4972_g2.t1